MHKVTQQVLKKTIPILVRVKELNLNDNQENLKNYRITYPDSPDSGIKDLALPLQLPVAPPLPLRCLSPGVHSRPQQSCRSREDERRCFAPG